MNDFQNFGTGVLPDAGLRAPGCCLESGLSSLAANRRCADIGPPQCKQGSPGNAVSDAAGPLGRRGPLCWGAASAALAGASAAGRACGDA